MPADPSAVASAPPQAASFVHLDRLTDQRGLFEHADGTVHRKEHGYCTDDNARLLVVACREPDVGTAHRLARVALEFVRASQSSDGRFRNRMDSSGRWTDRPTSEDCWGRAVWALGTAAAHHDDPAVRQRARRAFDTGVRQRSEWSRAMAFASIGAAEVVGIDADHGPARALLIDAIEVIGPVPSGEWAWPEPRLRYANAVLAESLIAAGAAVGDTAALDRGLGMLGWLLELETRLGHLSVVGMAGRSPGDVGPQFDQQPIEVAAMADACWRAHVVTGDETWARGLAAAAGWFEGDNDTGAVMHDAASGGGYDGLQRVGVNLNQGAESTLAYVSTVQRSNALARC